MFTADSIMQWSAVKNTCPMCKSALRRLVRLQTACPWLTREERVLQRAMKLAVKELARVHAAARKGVLAVALHPPMLAVASPARLRPMEGDASISDSDDESPSLPSRLSAS